MNYWRCKCGKRTAWESGMSPRACEGCRECGTTLAMYPDGHKPVEDHELVTIYDRYTGLPKGQECSKCYKQIRDASR